MNDREQPSDNKKQADPKATKLWDHKCTPGKLCPCGRPRLDEAKPVPSPAEESKDGAQTKISAWKVQ